MDQRDSRGRIICVPGRQYCDVQAISYSNLDSVRGCTVCPVHQERGAMTNKVLMEAIVESVEEMSASDLETLIVLLEIRLGLKKIADTEPQKA
jgi:hypothetical protein